MAWRSFVAVEVVYGRFCRVPAILLAVLVVASSCGGDEEQAPGGDDGDQAQEFEQPLDVASPDPAEPNADQSEQSEEDPGLGPVQLGSRFPWCPDIQDRWNGMVDALAAVAAAEVAYRDAQEAFEAATDELDAAEARGVLELAERALEEEESNLALEARGAVPLIIPGRPPIDDTTTANIETHAIAVERAREAFRASADPVTLEMSELIHQVDWSVADLTAIQEPASLTAPATTSPAPPDDPRSEYEAVLAAIDDMRVAVLEAPSALAPALEELGRARALVAAVESPEDVVAASRALIETMRILSRVPTFDGGDLQQLVDRYQTRVRNQYGWGAGEISRDERDEYIWETSKAAEGVEFPDISAQLPAWVTAEFGEGQHPDYALASYVLYASRHAETLLVEMRPVGEGLMLADTNALEAFWESISESCEA